MEAVSKCPADDGQKNHQSTFAIHLSQFRHHDETTNTDQPPGRRPVTRSSLTGKGSAKRKAGDRVDDSQLSNDLDGSSTQPKAIKLEHGDHQTPKKKRRRESSRYAPPSKYAHLAPLQDILEPNLICVFVGTNPGIRTATAGHAYAHPSNLFWKLLHSSGCTAERLRPQQDVDLPRLYAMGNTNIVERPSKDAAELSKAEMAAGTPILEEKFAKYKPEAVCIVGKGIWEAIWRWRYKREIRKDEFKYGWQDDRERMGRTPDWEGARVFVASSTSGLSASLRPHEKEAIWKPFGEWVKQRREERSDQQVT